MAIPKKKVEKSIIWRAAEYEYSGKSVVWYVIVGTATALLTLSALWQHNFFFAVFILIAGAMLIILGRKHPRVMNFTVNDKGVSIGKLQFYEYDDLEGFTIRNRPNHLDELVIKRKTSFNPFVKIPIDSKLAPQVKAILTSHIKEIEYNESLIDTLADLFGF